MNDSLRSSASTPTFCPACWERLAQDAAQCPACGTDIAHYLAETDYGAQLIEAVTGNDARRRLMAASILGERRESRAIPALRGVVLRERHDPHISKAAVEALIKIGGQDVIDVLHIVRDGHPIRQVRQAASTALSLRPSTP